MDYHPQLNFVGHSNWCTMKDVEILKMQCIERHILKQHTVIVT